MNSNDFVSWLQGFLEACGDNLSPEQLQTLKAKASNVQKGLPAVPYTGIRQPEAGKGIMARPQVKLLKS